MRAFLGFHLPSTKNKCSRSSCADAQHIGGPIVLPNLHATQPVIVSILASEPFLGPGLVLHSEDIPIRRRSGMANFIPSPTLPVHQRPSVGFFLDAPKIQS